MLDGDSERHLDLGVIETERTLDHAHHEPLRGIGATFDGPSGS